MCGGLDLLALGDKELEDHLDRGFCILCGMYFAGPTGQGDRGPRLLAHVRRQGHGEDSKWHKLYFVRLKEISDAQRRATLRGTDVGHDG